jgi:hypothetical protein
VATTPAAASRRWAIASRSWCRTWRPAEGLRDRFGKQVARELRSQIEDLHTHQTVSDRDLRDALRRYSLSGEDLYECIRARQLAMQQGWGLVLCGDYENVGGRRGAGDGGFVGAQDGETFEVEPFTVSERDARGAAQRILQTFDSLAEPAPPHAVLPAVHGERAVGSGADNCEQALAINPSSRSAQYMIAYIHWQTERAGAGAGDAGAGARGRSRSTRTPSSWRASSPRRWATVTRRGATSTATWS